MYGQFLVFDPSQVQLGVNAAAGQKQDHTDIHDKGSDRQAGATDYGEEKDYTLLTRRLSSLRGRAERTKGE